MNHKEYFHNPLLDAIVRSAREEQQTLNATDTERDPGLSEGELRRLVDGTLSQLERSAWRNPVQERSRFRRWLLPVLAAAAAGSVLATRLDSPRDVAPRPELTLLRDFAPGESKTPIRGPRRGLQSGTDTTAQVPELAAIWPKATWVLNGSQREAYTYEVEPDRPGAGKRAETHIVRSREGLSELNGFGGAMARMAVGELAGYRVRMTGEVRAEEVRNWAGLWMRVDRNKKVLAFDNMGTRPIVGTSDWQSYQVVLDVDRTADTIAFGVLLDGTGSIFTRNVRFERLQMVPQTTSNQWNLWGDQAASYELGEETLHGIVKSSYLRSIQEEVEGFGALGRSVSADSSRGKRLKLSATLRTNSVQQSSGLWMRVDGKPGEEPLAFDNMANRPVAGTTSWQNYEVVLDVAEQATHIAFGVLLSGTGQVWLKDLSLDEVGDDVPTTH